MSLHSYLKRIVEHRDTLRRIESRALLEEILAAESEVGAAHSLQLAALLGALGTRGETADELAGFVDAMRGAATALPLTEAERDLLVDTCGTGGDASGTFNISTAAALVAAAAGATVAKHGNRAVTSACGSADVIEALGISVTLSPEAAAHALRAHRFAFLHAAALHPAMKAVMPVRRALGVRTVFNILGPLSNPARARAQVMGVYSAHLVPLVADAMAVLGIRHAFVVHGAIEGSALGMDELSISGPSQIADVRNGVVTYGTVTPEDVGLRRAPLAPLGGGDASTNAAILRAIFRGEPGPPRDVVLLNAAAVLITSGHVPSSPAGPIPALRAGIALAASAIDSGSVTALLAVLAGPS